MFKHFRILLFCYLHQNITHSLRCSPISNYKGSNISDCINDQFNDCHVTFSLSVQISLYNELENSSLRVCCSHFSCFMSLGLLFICQNYLGFDMFMCIFGYLFYLESLISNQLSGCNTLVLSFFVFLCTALRHLRSCEILCYFTPKLYLSAK